jgi:hypothetical protein
MRRRALFALLGARLVARPAAVAAQQPPKVHVILWVSRNPQVVPVNPASSVRGPRHVLLSGCGLSHLS